MLGTFWFEKEYGEKMKKQVLWLGIFILMIALISAVLVDYYSNATTITISIESPILNEISNDNINFGSSATLNTYGGDTEKIYMRMTNRANTAITGKIIETITSSNISCNNFSSISAFLMMYDSSNRTIDLLPSCINYIGYITMSIDNTPWSSLGQDNITISLTFVPNVVGTFDFNTKVMI